MAVDRLQGLGPDRRRSAPRPRGRAGRTGCSNCRPSQRPEPRRARLAPARRNVPASPIRCSRRLARCSAARCRSSTLPDRPHPAGRQERDQLVARTPAGPDLPGQEEDRQGEVVGLVRSDGEVLRLACLAARIAGSSAATPFSIRARPGERGHPQPVLIMVEAKFHVPSASCASPQNAVPLDRPGDLGIGPARPAARQPGRGRRQARGRNRSD